MGNTENKLIVALDVDSFEEAKGLVDQLADSVQIFKVGSQLFTACGPVIVRYLMAKGKDVFLDLKYHDIPNTVANAIESAVMLSSSGHEVLDEKKQKVKNLGSLFMITIHLSGGLEMCSRAVEAATKVAESIGVTKPLLVGITVLTSEKKNR